MARTLTAALCLALLTGCVTQPGGPDSAGARRCEAFFIYEICIADHDRDGAVDYVYFGDDMQIFMFVEAMRPALEGLQPFHACAVPMSARVRDNSSRLLYGEDLGLTERLTIKGKLIGDYRSAQPAIDACHGGSDAGARPARYDDPFLVEEDWEEDWEEEQP